MSVQTGASLKVGDIASKDVVTIGKPATIRTASRIMREKGIGGLVVMEDDKPVGMVTERNIMNGIVAKKLDPSNTNVGAIMSSPLITAPYETDVRDAAGTMLEKGIRRLVVLKDGKLYGIVTTKDVVKALLKLLGVPAPQP